jgi:hypothetical protein
LVKEKVVPWEAERFKTREGHLKTVEQSLELLYKDHPVGLFDEEVLGKIMDLEFQKNKLLLDKEKDWCIKRKATWLALGDQTLSFSTNSQTSGRAKTLYGN